MPLENYKYQLQCCQGNVNDENDGGDLFYEVYLGPETCYIVRDLKPNYDYSFRVCKYGNEDKVWSLPYIARTTLAPYSKFHSFAFNYELPLNLKHLLCDRMGQHKRKL